MTKYSSTTTPTQPKYTHTHTHIYIYIYTQSNETKIRDIKGIKTMGEGKDEIIMLFGVRVVVDSLRKTVSLNNLSQYDHLNNNNNNNNNCNKEDTYALSGVVSGYVSTDETPPPPPHPSRAHSERKRGVAWTEEEHKLFLMGLKKVGKGDWRSISRNFVKTRTPTQVASHAQKYFLRRANLNRRRRRRSSLFDITTDQVSEISVEEQQAANQEKNIAAPHDSHVLPPPQPETTNVANLSALSVFTANFSSANMSVPTESREADIPSANPIRPSPSRLAPPVCDLNLDLNLSPTFDASPLSSLASDQRRHFAFQVMQSCKNGDSIISVA